MGSNLIRKMASKKRQDIVQWQLEATCDEEWKDLCKLEGLVVIDVYSEWCGPCIVMAPQLKELKLQLGDDLLHFAIAKADRITQLVKFRGRSEPTWLFMANGEPVAVMRGANAPLIRQNVIAELEKEKQVLDGLCERITIEWTSIDFPRAVDETEVEEKVVEEIRPKTELPENWIDLDAILLKGFYSKILEPIHQQFSEANIDIVSESHVEGDELNGPMEILWLNINEDDDTVVEFLENLLDSVIQEGIKALKEELKEVETVKEEEPGDDQSPPFPLIEFQLLFNQQEKEDFINQLVAEPCEPADDGPVFFNVETEEEGATAEEITSREQENETEEGPDSQQGGDPSELTSEPNREEVHHIETENPQVHVEDCSDDKTATENPEDALISTTTEEASAVESNQN